MYIIILFLFVLIKYVDQEHIKKLFQFALAWLLLLLGSVPVYNIHIYTYLFTHPSFRTLTLVSIVYRSNIHQGCEYAHQTRGRRN